MSTPAGPLDDTVPLGLKRQSLGLVHANAGLVIPWHSLNGQRLPTTHMSISIVTTTDVDPAVYSLFSRVVFLEMDGSDMCLVVLLGR